MDNTIVKKNKSLKCGLAIKSLSIISLICTALGSISYFFYYDSERINNEWVYELTFCFPSPFNLISLILILSPNILLVLYLFKFFKEPKGAVIIPIVFACMGASALSNIIYVPTSYYYYFVYGSSISFIINVITFITFILATISALKGLSTKAFIIIPTVWNIILSLISLITILLNSGVFLDTGWVLSLFTTIISISASITFNIALLLFGLKNIIPSTLTVSTHPKNGVSPEKSLKLLKNKLDLGIITEEEYQSQRAEIIKNL